MISSKTQNETRPPRHREASPEATFDALVDDSYDALVKYALRRVGKPEDAADIVAETYLIAWSKFDQPIRDPRPWLFGIARNVIFTHRRGELKQLAIADELREELASQGTVAQSTDLSLDVQRALATLSPHDQEAIMLTAWDGLTHKEAARSLKISQANFRVRLFRARRRLRTALNHAPSSTTAITTAGASSC